MLHLLVNYQTIGAGRGTCRYRNIIHSLARHLSDARASSVYRSYARLTIVSALMHFIVSEYVSFVHVFYDNSVHRACIDLRSIKPKHTHSPTGMRIIDTLRRISFEIHLRSSIRCLVHEPHAHTQPRYTRLILGLSPRIVTRIRVIGAVILTIRHSLLARIRGDTPLAIIRAKCIIFIFRYRGTHEEFWLISETCIGTDFSCENVVAKHSRVYARDTDTCMYREAFTMSRKNVALLQNSRKKLVIVRLDSERWRAVQCSPQCTRPKIFVRNPTTKLVTVALSNVCYHGARAVQRVPCIVLRVRGSTCASRAVYLRKTSRTRSRARVCAGNFIVPRTSVLCVCRARDVADGARGGKSIRYRVHHPKIIPQNRTRKSIHSSRKKSDTNLYRSLSKKVTVHDNQKSKRANTNNTQRRQYLNFMSIIHLYSPMPQTHIPRNHLLLAPMHYPVNTTEQ